MRIHPFQGIYPNFDYITSPDTFFGNVKQEYPQYAANGFFNKSSNKGLYIYRIEDAHNTCTGLICSVDIRDYLEGKIKKHENTLAAKEQKQMHLLFQRKAMVKPVLLIHPEIQALDNILTHYIANHSPFYTTTFEEEGQKHTFWEIAEENDIQKVQTVFKEHIPETYIADGHHRSSTTALLHERRKGKEDAGRYDKMLCAFFPYQALVIHDYNRVIEDLGNLSSAMFMAQLSQVFHIHPLNTSGLPAHKHQIVLFLEGEWYKLDWKQKILEADAHSVTLDAGLLDKYVLRDILNIENTSTDGRVKYVEGTVGLDEFTSRIIKEDKRIGFCLYPVELQDLLRVADLNQTMPPKSTWFEPRMKNGLIVLEI